MRLKIPSDPGLSERFVICLMNSNPFLPENMLNFAEYYSFAFIKAVLIVRRKLLDLRVCYQLFFSKSMAEVLSLMTWER